MRRMSFGQRSGITTAKSKYQRGRYPTGVRPTLQGQGALEGIFMPKYI
jgi:hypothetical protein